MSNSPASEFYLQTFRNTLSVPCSWASSEFYMPTFRNTLSVPSSWAGSYEVPTCLWVISRRLNFICRRFGTLCLFHLHGHRLNFIYRRFGTLCLFHVHGHCLNFIYRRFGTLCLFHVHGQVVWSTYLPMKMEYECSETSTYKIKTPWHYSQHLVL